MMKRILFTPIIIISVYGLSQSPAGIKGTSYWYKASESELDSTSNAMINFYPAHQVNDENIISDIQGVENAEEMTAFVVLKPSFLQQKYHMMDIKSDQPVTTFQSDRISAKRELKIKNYDSDKPYFFSYIESFEKEESDTLIEGSVAPQYAHKFEGEIGEIIYYPKLLSALKRRKVESYLSIKYGISLPVESDYINSQNDTIWKSDENRKFKYRVTGIGKDSEGNLDHKQSSNVDDYGLLAIGFGSKIEPSNKLNKEEIENHNYFLWADNNAPPAFEESESPEVSLLKRGWYAKIIGKDIPSKEVSLSFDTDLFIQNDITGNETTDSEKPSELKYWLVASPKSNEINIQNAEFLKWEPIPEGGGPVEFEGVPLFGLGESFLFTLAKAPEIFALAETEETDCQVNISLKIKGGIAPYQVELYSSNDTKTPLQRASENVFKAFHLPSGNYTCIITDSLNQRVEQNILINDFTAGKIELENIILTAGESKIIDLTKAQNAAISDVIWYRDDVEIGSGLKISINKKGDYHVAYRNMNDCTQTTMFKVIELPSEEWSGIYPNPIKVNEPFFVNLKQFSESQMHIVIRDHSGRIVKSSIMKKGSEVYSDTFYSQGIYSISVENDSEQENYTLIIK